MCIRDRDWVNRGLVSSVQINAANRTFSGLVLDDTGSGDGAAIGFRYDGSGYKLELATAPSSGGALSTHLTIDRLGAITTSGHLDVANELTVGNTTILKDSGVVTIKAAPLGSTYGGGFNAITVTGTSSNPYTSTIGFSNYGETNAMVIKGKNIGIGNNNPYFPLHVQGATGFNGEAKNNILPFETASATTGTGGGIAFGGYTNGTGGDVYHFGNIQGIKENSTAGNTASAMLFSTRANGATPLEHMRIDSSGNVMIGKPAANTTAAGHTFFQYGRHGVTVNSTTCQIINRLGNDGTITLFEKDNAAVGTINVLSGRMGIGSGDTGLFFDSTRDCISPFSVTANDGQTGIDLGRTGVKFKDIHLSSNVLFGGNLHFNAATNSSYIGPASTSNIQYAADGYHRFQTYNGSWGTIYDIADTGIYQSEGNFAYHSLVPLFGTNVSSYSSSTNIDWADSGSLSVPDRGEKLVAQARVRAYTNYVHFKTNLSADNIMFYFRTRGYQYGSGMEEHVYGGYTYNSNSVISVEHLSVYGGTHTLASYRDSSGYLVLRMHANQTGYTEGRQYIFFSSHSESVTRELQITAVKQRDDGNNAF